MFNTFGDFSQARNVLPFYRMTLYSFMVRVSIYLSILQTKKNWQEINQLNLVIETQDMESYFIALQTINYNVKEFWMITNFFHID